MMLVLLLLLQSGSTRYTQFCPGGFWNGQQCAPCLNQNCRCSEYLGCDSMACPNATIQDSLHKTCVQCPLGCS